MSFIYQQNNLKDYKKDINNELYILKLLSSNKNSVKYYGKYEKEKEKVIVMELCDKNLKEFMIEKNRALTVEEIKTKFLELNELFKEIQKENIIHRDLKLENFLVKYNKEKTDYIIKLGDYGTGKLKNNPNTIFSGLKGTPENVAPEIILEREQKYENTVDIFSLGIILYQLSHNLKHPFGENPINHILTYDKNYEKDDLKIEFSETIKNDDFKDLISRMIKLNPKNRLKWEDYFRHKYFK